MGAIAKWFIFGMFALTKPNFLFLVDIEWKWSEFRSLVRSVAKGLVFTSSAGAPIVGAWFKR